jgi:cyanophycin synthetase
MELLRIWTLRGPNRWARVPVLEVEIDLGEHSQANPDKLCDLALDLQRQCGSDVQFRQVIPMAGAGRHRVVFEFEEEALAHAALTLAFDLWRALARGESLDALSRLAELRELAHDVCLGPSTTAIVRAARARNIPMRRLGSGSLVVLGQASRQRRVCTAETDRTSAIAETIAQDKDLTRQLLRGVGVPVPYGRPVSDVEDAWHAAEDLGLPVVLKPRYGNHGRGVATNLSTRQQIEHAYAAALEESSNIMVEQHIQGDDYRLLVIGGKLVAAALREPAHVIGNGTSPIRQLVDEVNKDPRRSDGHATSLSFIKLDAVGLGVLGEQGFTPESIPSAGQRVLIRRNGNLSTGGTATDVTDRVHPEVAARAVDAARMVGLDIAGVDLVATDVGLTMEEQRAAIVEVNAGPGLRMHLEPSAGTPRPVGEVILDMLFPDGGNGRIPTVAVTGVNGKTTTTRLIAHLFKQAGKVVGMTCTDGIYIDGLRIEKNNCSGPRSARAVLLNPRVEAAVLETARGGILREGLGFDCCDVAVVTNIGQGDHLGLDGVDTVEDLARVKRIVVEAVGLTGTAVLNAADPLVAAMAPHCPGKVAWFARDASPGVLADHRRSGGRAVFVREESIVLAAGTQEEVLLALEAIPLTHGGKVHFQVENVLAATAAAWSLGLPLDVIRAGLASFLGDARQAPGRFNVLEANGATVIVDYAHNTSALVALVEALDQLPHRRRSIVFKGCSRGDADHVGMGEIVSSHFDRVILCTERENGSTVLGKYEALLRRGLAVGKRLKETVEAFDERSAIETALRDLKPGELIVFGVEAIDEALALVEARLRARD